MGTTIIPGRRGQIIVPLAPRALAGLDPAQIATEVAPLIIAEAAKVGGHPIGEPELLREAELRTRTTDPDLLANVDAHPDRLWLVAEMVPLDQARSIIRAAHDGRPARELVVPPVVRRRR